MLAILSPAKSMDFDSPLHTKKYSVPNFVDESQTLVNELRKYAPNEIASLMGISDNLAELNHRRYTEWTAEFPAASARPAILAFSGEVYTGLNGPTMSTRDHTWAQKHVRILSGLHGLLRPLDRICPYRLEMGTRLKTQHADNLYGFWGNRVTQALNAAIAEQGDQVLVNLASDEYYHVLQPETVDARIIKIHFKEWKNGKYRFLSFFAKKARGSMVRYMIDHRVKTLKALKAFDYDGYAYSPQMSEDDDWVFTRNRE